LFVITGASLGVLFRKGGFTIAVGLSFGFFLIYYIMMIGGEDLADRNIVSPVVGVWSPNVILLIISMYLILHTIKEQAPLASSFTFLKKILKKIGRQKNNQ
jgi:lipopolysaccharide export system permease protein